MNRISIEVDEKTEALVERLAKDAGISVSDFSREALLDYAKKFDPGCITTEGMSRSA